LTTPAAAWRTRLPRFTNLPLAALMLAGLLPGPARAEFPDHPLRLIVPFATGGAVDGIARLAAGEFGNALGQAVVIDNRPGSGGTVGILGAANAPADGYTLLLGNIALASAPALYPKSGISTGQFAAVGLIGRSAYVVAVKIDFPAKTIGEFITLAKASPGKYNYASAGSGSAIHLAAELLKTDAGIDLVHVPYKGAGPAMTALIGGEVEMMFGSLSELKPMIEAKRIRPIAVSTATRAQALPNVPTLAEAGVRDYAVSGWYGFFAPAKTPPEALRKLQAAAQKAVASDTMRQQLAGYDMEPSSGGVKEAEDLLNADAKRWAEVIRRAKIKAD
jgi:tripartite-type tricarboxylate transporter receptor subunit TctC